MASQTNFINVVRKVFSLAWKKSGFGILWNIYMFIDNQQHGDFEIYYYVILFDV